MEKEKAKKSYQDCRLDTNRHSSISPNINICRTWKGIIRKKNCKMLWTLRISYSSSVVWPTFVAKVARNTELLLPLHNKIRIIS